jgi:hypothetical protein
MTLDDSKECQMTVGINQPANDNADGQVQVGLCHMTVHERS